MKQLWVVGAAACVVAALLDLWVTLRPEPGPIPAETMVAAAKAVRSIQKTGDHVVHSPLFSVKELAGLGDLIARPDKPTPGVRASRRIIVIDRDGAPMGGLGTPSEVQSIGDGVQLRIFQPQPREDGAAASVYLLLTGFDQDTLTIERPKGRISSRCTATRAEGGFSCPGEAEWLYVAPRTLRIGGEDRQCLWAHPTTGGAVVFRIPPQPAPPPAMKLELVVEAGIADDAVTGTPDGATVRLDFEQANKRVGGLTVTNTVGWKNAVQTIAPDEPARIVITTPKDGRRHLCLDAHVREVKQ